MNYENDCLDSVTGNYKTKQVYSYDNLYQLIKVDGETTYNPYKSSSPEFVSNYSQLFEFDSDGLGNMTSKVSTETVSPQKSIGDNLNYSFNYVYDENFAHRLVRAGDRYYKYDANGNIICEQDGSFESNGDDVSYHKITQEAEDVYSTDYGWGLFKDDDSNTSIKSKKYSRTYVWNEKNQLISSIDANYNTAYLYGQDGQRTNKYTQNSETLYFNKMWTLHTDSGNNVYGGQSAKNIYLGETRIVTKLNSGENPTYQEEYYKQYFYHSDHLGSASLISDYKGDEYQRIEYTPYGETWVEKTSNTGLEFLPYKFTAKELDEETGLYYYGARYLDPKYSMWISTDPALGEYIPKAPITEEAKRYNSNLPGMGGLFNTVNMNLYHYAANNPIKYTDPDGREEYDLVNDTKKGFELIFKLACNLPKGDITFENCPFSEANALSNFMNEKPEFWAILGGAGLFAGVSFLCPPIKNGFTRTYNWLMQFNEDYLLSNGIDITTMSYSFNDNDITKFTAQINNINLGAGSLNTNVLLERVLYKINDERGNILKLNCNLDLSKDKSNVTFELSFMVNGQYRSKDYEKIISDFAF